MLQSSCLQHCIPYRKKKFRKKKYLTLNKTHVHFIIKRLKKKKKHRKLMVKAYNCIYCDVYDVYNNVQFYVRRNKSHPLGRFKRRR